MSNSNTSKVALLASQLIATASELESAINDMCLDDYEAEQFYKGLSDTKTFSDVLNWLVERHSK